MTKLQLQLRQHQQDFLEMAQHKLRSARKLERNSAAEMLLAWCGNLTKLLEE